MASPGNEKESSLMISQQYDYLNKTWKSITLTDILPWEGKIPWGHSPRQRTASNYKVGEIVFHRDESLDWL